MGNLSYETTEGELQTLISEVAAVSEVFFPKDRATGRARGFAFVELQDESGNAEVIEKFDGKELNGRTLRVNEARAREPRPAGGGFGGGGPHMDPRDMPRAKPKGSRRNLRGRKRAL